MKNCVLILGDGFSRSLLHYLGLSDEIRTSPFTPEQWLAVPYVPLGPDDPFAQQPLWSQDLFPRLFTEWEAFKRAHAPDSAFFQFCGQLAGQGHLNFAAGSGGLTLSQDTAAYQLRAFLWNLFRYFEIVIHTRAEGLPIYNWPWLQFLERLRCAFRLRIVSFNYDVLAEGALSTLAIPAFAPTAECRKRLTEQTNDEVVVLKPHGSISHCPPGIGAGPHHWLSQVRVAGVDMTPFAIETAYPRRLFPMIPDLVPPGHAGLHLVNYQTDVVDGVRQACREAQLLILCGLSAQEPDTGEVADYLACAPANLPALHIGIFPQDEQIDAARILRGITNNYTACDGRSLDGFDRWITRAAAEQGRR